MSEQISTSEILSIINERDKHTQEKIVKMTETLERVCAHIIVSEEDKKHDAEFKKEVRGHIKMSLPLLLYVTDQKTLASKLKMAFYAAIMFAALTLLGFNIK